MLVLLTLFGALTLLFLCAYLFTEYTQNTGKAAVDRLGDCAWMSALVFMVIFLSWLT